jgi:cytoplasmic iron level regulating protein YaaA (DUF328/UPF0246 family)
MSQTNFLVSCSAKKQMGKHPARQLCCSDWFIKASAYAERHGDHWFILSSKYGLLEPDSEVEDYDVVLKDKTISERKIWAKQVMNDLKSKLNLKDHVIILAGKTYREFLVDPIQQFGCTVEVPMEHLRIGEQLHWLKDRLGNFE